MKNEFNTGDIVELPSNEEGILIRILPWIWGFTHIVKITTATFNQIGDEVEFKPEQLKKKQMKDTESLPRNAQLEKLTKEERALLDVITLIDDLPAHPNLTHIVTDLTTVFKELTNHNDVLLGVKEHLDLGSLTKDLEIGTISLESQETKATIHLLIDNLNETLDITEKKRLSWRDVDSKASDIKKVLAALVSLSNKHSQDRFLHITHKGKLLRIDNTATITTLNHIEDL